PRGQSDSITAVWLPEGYDADKTRQLCLDKFNVSLGGGLDRLRGRVLRIGHLGDLNEPMILGAIAAVEMALELTGVPHGRGGVQAAMDYLVSAGRPKMRRRQHFVISVTATEGRRNERRHSPGLSRNHDRDDRRELLPNPFDLRQGGRHVAPGYRPEIASCVDRRAATSDRHRRPARPFQ